MEWCLLATFYDQRVPFHAFLSEDESRLSVVDHYVAWLNRGDLRVKRLCCRAPIHVCEIAKLK